MQKTSHLLVIVMLLVGMTLSEVPAPVVHAAVVTLMVDMTTDTNNLSYQACTNAPDDCSLRGAISKSNDDLSQTYTIELPAGVYGLALSGGGEDDNASGDLDILRSLAITGAGADTTIIGGNSIDRVLHIHSGVVVDISNVTITGGRTADGDVPSGAASPGGGVYNAGNLTLKDCSIRDNATGAGGVGSAYPSDRGGNGGHGGGIYNESTLTVLDSSIIQNTTGAGGDGGSGGNGGHGGGIFNEGALTVNASSVISNTTGVGGSDEYYLGQVGSGGSGGGIYNESTLIVLDSSIMQNTTGAGGDGRKIPESYFSIESPDWGSGGNGGHGGGIYNEGTLSVLDSSIIQNTAGAGGSGGYLMEDSYGGSGGDGGGIYNVGYLLLTGITLEDNLAGDGGSGGFDLKVSYRGGSGGRGGGLYNAGSLSSIDSLIASNTAGSGGGPGGTSGPGGGMYIAEGSVWLRNTSIRENHSGNGGDGSRDFYGFMAGASGGTGGGIFNHGTLSLVDSLVEENISGDGGYGGGSGGDGGGIYNEGTMLISASPIERNRTGSGARAPSEWPVPDYGGSGGSGGGIFNRGALTVNISSVISNTTGVGGSGGEYGGQGGSGGNGGGIYNAAGTLELAYSAVEANSTGQGGEGGGGSDGGHGGHGGGIYNSGGLTLNGVSVLDNLTGQGGSGDPPGSHGSGGSGGGVYILDSNEVTLSSTLLATNQVDLTGYGSGLYLSNASPDLVHTTLACNTGGDGSGIFAISSTVALTNTILVSHTVGINVDSSSKANLDATLWGSGAWANDTYWDGTGTIFTGTINIWNEPDFGDYEAGDYHINPDSAAIDAGVDAGVKTDMDNQPRPYQTPDIGADEYWPPGTPKYIYLPLVTR